MDTSRIRNQTKPQTTDSEVDDLLALNELFKKIEGLDLEKVERQLESAKSPIEKTIEGLLKNEKLITRKKARKKVHYKTKLKRRRERYAETYGPRRKARLADLMVEGGWWPRMEDTWKRHKVSVELTRDEWDQIVSPCVGGYTPIINRYNTKEAISLGNIWVTDSDSGRVLWDGKEYILRSLGYIL